MRIFIGIFLWVSVQGSCLAQVKDPKNIVIFGAGYVGTVSGACLAKCGHKITLIEPDGDKVAMLRNKKSPILEPNLEKLIGEGIDGGLLDVKDALGSEILDADVAMIAVATPTTDDGKTQLDCLTSVLNLLYEATKQRVNPLVVSIRSTILPTDFQQLKNSYPRDGSVLSLVVNPEFLREASAVNDFFHPPFCVAGGDNRAAVDKVLSLYQSIEAQRFAVNGETACFLKYACNAFHAAKIVFTNEITSLCESLAINPVELMRMFSEDKLLNGSSAYGKPGFAFGGPCLAKDLRALVTLGSGLGDFLPLLSSIMPSNQCRFNKVVNQILRGNHRTLAVLGLSFKQHSDDLRESPFVALIKCLKREGIMLRVFDPDVRLERLAKVNKDILLQCLDDNVVLVNGDVAVALVECDGVVVCKNLLDAASIEQLKSSGIPMYNLGYFSLSKEGE